MTQAIINSLADYDWEYDEGEEGLDGVIRWKTLISQPKTETKGLSCGILEMPPGSVMGPHYHAPQEIYYVIDGWGVLQIDTEIKEVAAGSVVYIPQNMVHGVKNMGDELLTLLWIFPTDSYYDIEYLYDKTS